MKALRFLAVLVTLGALSTEASAFTLEPMTAVLTPSGAGSIGTFHIKNDGTDKIAIKLTVVTRSLSEDGKEENAPTSAFMVYPSRLLVEPGATAAAKVQWKGSPAIAAEQTFRLIAEEVSIDTSPDTSSGIKMRFRYIASLYVGKASFNAKLMAKVDGAQGSNGEKGFSVELANTGTRHVVAMKMHLSLSRSDGPAIELTADDLGALNGTNYLPSSTRKLFIPNEAAEVGKSYDAQLDYDSEY